MQQPATLVSHLGQTRTRLLVVLGAVPDDRLNSVDGGDQVDIGRLVMHVSAVETILAKAVFQALPLASVTVEEHDLSEWIARYDDDFDWPLPRAEGRTREELLAALDESRFKYTQAIFNKAHEAELAAKSMLHPVFGMVNLKSVMDFIWQHEQHHVDEIVESRAQFVDAPSAAAPDVAGRGQ